MKKWTQKHRKKHQHPITLQSHIILKTPENCEMLLQTTYYVKNDSKFWGITLFAGVLIFFTIVEVWRILTNPDNIGNPELSMLIASFSFTAFVLTLRKDDYEIPCARFVIVSIIFTIIGMVFILVIYLFGLNLNLIWGLINNLIKM
ncbi:MAG: hypothetical protein Q8N08_09440 [Methanobacteriaceae archaeon]|nr:hypothetical protein [Methanobacteriaceae archaeon]